MDPRVYWMAFNLIKGIGAVRLQALLDYFGDLSKAWGAPAEELRQAGLSQRIVESVQRVRRDVDLEILWAKLKGAGTELYTWEDPLYPRLLKEIDQPPPVLFAKGGIVAQDEWAVAIVGTRRVTGYGRQVTEELSSFLAQRGITVVSGLARGTDAIAHQAALKAGGRTIAVLGSGVDRIYPPEHRKLAEEIAASGSVVSDYPLGTPPESTNFPPRNRIISGLSKAVVIIEAGETSGALITASFAADQSRDVLSVPGPIYAPQSKGTNRLIQQGARPLLSVTDIFEVLDLEHAESQQEMRAVIPADEVEASLYRVLDSQPLHVDELSEKTGLPISKVSAALTLMELKGMVRHVGAMSYVSIREDYSDYRTDSNV